jgi:hypothetical protein
MKNKTLTEIGIHYGTDKATFHGFTDIYDRYFTPLRDKQLNILEIGIDRGYSILTLRDYFINSQIYAIDCLDKSHLSGDRFIFNIGDQADRNFMQHLFRGIEFDIIIDDGGHGMEQQQVTLEEMLPRLKSGGIYVLEDLHTSYEYGYTGNRDDNTTLTLIENINNLSAVKKNNFFINDLTEVQRQVSTCNVYYNDTASGKAHRGKSITSVIYKK